ALVVLAGGGYLFVGQPLFAMYTDMDTKISNAKSSWEEDKESFINSEKLRARFEKSREALVIEGEEAEKRQRILQDLTTLLEETEISPQSSQMNSTDRIDDDFVIYSFSCKTIYTDWPKLARLLYEIENSDAILEVSRMNVKRNNRRSFGDQEQAELVVDLEISRLVENKVERRRRARR
ncbi:MAG: hypothetical protein KC994_25065, partial [Candidatus Omnitrophica bacterium]|nr:hypothetical protein [Candidatus Omnitrophota bacterium]